MSNVTGPDEAQQKNQKFEELVNLHQTALLRMCFIYLQDQALAQDAVQETFLKAYRSMDLFRGDSSEKTWLIRIAVNTCRDLRRSSYFRLTDRRYTPDMLPEASAPFEEKDESIVLSVMKLPIKLREVILLHYYQEMTTVDIAHSLGLSQSAVSGRLKRARDKLRNILEGRELL